MQDAQHEQPTGSVRHYVFTLNNPDPQLLEHPETLVTGAIPKVRYAIWQLETGVQGTQHFQGYLECTSAVRYSHFRTTNLGRAWFGKRQGSRDQARDYCRKEESRTGGPWEFGDWGSGGSGKRTDLTDACETLKRGATLSTLAEEHTAAFVKYHRGFERAIGLLSPVQPRDPDNPVTVILNIGPSGCGKTRLARELAGDCAFWMDTSKWWDGYDPRIHDTIVMDDFSGHSLSYGIFKRVCDRYPLTVEVKGSTVQMACTRFILTSCLTPDKWWNPETCRNFIFLEIARRITVVNGWDSQAEQFINFQNAPTATALDQYLESPCHN